MDLVTSLNNLEVTFRQLYEQERMSSRVNKGAYAVLLLPYSQSTTQNSTGLWDKRHMFNVSMPGNYCAQGILYLYVLLGTDTY